MFLGDSFSPTVLKVVKHEIQPSDQIYFLTSQSLHSLPRKPRQRNMYQTYIIKINTPTHAGARTHAHTHVCVYAYIYVNVYIYVYIYHIIQKNKQFLV